jgi:hypothetical protein
MDYAKQMIKVGAISGIIGVLLYLVLAISDPYIGPETRTTQEFLGAWGTPKYVAVNMGLHFMLAGAAILWLVAFVGLMRLLGAGAPSVLVNIGTLLGVVACAVMVQMMIVQGSVMSKMGQVFLSATSESERQSAVALYKGLRFIDYGMDLAFDTFFFSAWILLGLRMLRHPSFGKVFGGIGIIFFVLAAIFNLRAAPNPPAFDIGPIAALWLLAVYIQMFRSAKSFSDVQPERTGV